MFEHLNFLILSETLISTANTFLLCPIPLQGRRQIESDAYATTTKSFIIYRCSLPLPLTLETYPTQTLNHKCICKLDVTVFCLYIVIYEKATKKLSTVVYYASVS